jgi:hypothetical protein
MIKFLFVILVILTSECYAIGRQITTFFFSFCHRRNKILNMSFITFGITCFSSKSTLLAGSRNVLYCCESFSSWIGLLRMKRSTRFDLTFEVPSVTIKILSNNRVSNNNVFTARITFGLFSRK